MHGEHHESLLRPRPREMRGLTLINIHLRVGALRKVLVHVCNGHVKVSRVRALERRLDIDDDFHQVLVDTGVIFQVSSIVSRQA